MQISMRESEFGSRQETSTSIIVPQLIPPTRISEGLRDSKMEGKIREYVLHWISNPDPGSEFDLQISTWRQGPLKLISDNELVQFLIDKGYDGLLHFHDDEVIAHSFYQLHADGKELHRMSVYVPKEHRSQGLAYLSSLDLITAARDLGCKIVILGRYSGQDVTRHIIDHVRIVQDSLDVNVDRDGIIHLMPESPRQHYFCAPSVMATSESKVLDYREQCIEFCRRFGRPIMNEKKVIIDAHFAEVNVGRGVHLRIFAMSSCASCFQCDVSVWSGTRLAACTSLGETFADGKPIVGVDHRTREPIVAKNIYSLRPAVAEACLMEVFAASKATQLQPSLIGQINKVIQQIQVAGNTFVGKRSGPFAPMISSIQQFLPAMLEKVTIVPRNEYDPLDGHDGCWEPWSGNDFRDARERRGIEVQIFDHRNADEHRILGHTIKLRAHVVQRENGLRVSAAVGIPLETTSGEPQFRWTVLPNSFVNRTIKPALVRNLGEEVLLRSREGFA